MKSTANINLENYDDKTKGFIRHMFSIIVVLAFAFNLAAAFGVPYLTWLGGNAMHLNNMFTIVAVVLVGITFGLWRFIRAISWLFMGTKTMGEMGL